jgi:hypothetical protein
MSRLPALKKLNADDLRKEIQGNGNLRDLVMGEILENKFPVELIAAMSDEEIVNKCGKAGVRTFICERIADGDSRFTSMAEGVAKTPPSKTSDKELAEAIKAFAGALEKAKLARQRKITAEARKQNAGAEVLKRALGALFQPTISKDEIVALLEPNKQDISSDPVMKDLVLRATQVAINRETISDVARSLKLI